MSLFRDFLKNYNSKYQTYLLAYSPKESRILINRDARQYLAHQMSQCNHERPRFASLDCFDYSESREFRLENWRNYISRKNRANTLGRMIANIISNSDHSDIAPDSLLASINAWEFRHVRRVADFCQILNDIYRGYYHSCGDCGKIEHEENFQWAYQDNPICEECIEGYRYSENQDTFITLEDWENENEDDDSESDGIIGDYHSTNIGRIPSSYDNRKPRVLLGLELEVEVDDCRDRYEIAESLSSKIQTIKLDDQFYRYCGFERDGSLDHGFEIVTGYTGLDIHRKALEPFKQSIKGLSSHNTSTCGLHVHICKADMSLYHAAKMILFVNDERNISLIKAIARRTRSDYAQILNKKDDKHWLKNARQCRAPLNNLNLSRYEALNFQNPKTIEFRLFKGSLKYETIISCLEFSFAVWHFTRNASIRNLDIDSFLKFICLPENRADTPYLRAYLKDKGFALPIIEKKEKPLPLMLDPNLVLS